MGNFLLRKGGEVFGTILFSIEQMQNLPKTLIPGYFEWRFI